MGEQGEYSVGYKRPPIETRFKPGVGTKPVGAKMRQITRARRLLEKAAKLPAFEGIELLNLEGEQLTEADAVYVVQLAKARLGDKDAAKFVMDYAGFKPSEHIELENKDVAEFPSEEEEREYRIRRMQDLLTDTDGVVSEAQKIVDATED